MGGSLRRVVAPKNRAIRPLLLYNSIFLKWGKTPTTYESFIYAEMEAYKLTLSLLLYESQRKAMRYSKIFDFWHHSVGKEIMRPVRPHAHDKALIFDSSILSKLLAFVINKTCG